MTVFTHSAFKKSAFALGFFISLMGTLPLGYLNVIGLQILLEKGNWAASSFIFGIVAVEFFVLKIASYGAKWLVEQKNYCCSLTFLQLFSFLASPYIFISILEMRKILVYRNCN